MSQRLDYEAAAPASVQAMARLHSQVSRSGLSTVLLDLVYLRISLINGCAYCIDMHSRALRAEGVEVDKLMLVPVWREGGDLFDDRERAALAWAESVTRVAETGVPDSDFDAVAKVFEEKQLADLTIAIGLMNAYNRLGVSFRSTPVGARTATS